MELEHRMSEHNYGKIFCLRPKWYAESQTWIKFPLKRNGCQVVVSVLIVLWDIYELLWMLVTIGT